MGDPGSVSRLLLLLDQGGDDISVRRGDVDVEAPLPAEGLPTVLAVHFFINPLLAFMDGSYMLCHVALS